MASDAVPYCSGTALMPTQKQQHCSFEVAPVLPWSTHTGRVAV